ncbi:hypothetical protein [Martelella mangrovi]|uniref:Uncharacterized protein n=1 Tax=Martelella mangrovi TaxID=1397477 RepID=A0ABV2I8H1_9HYPH
MALNRFSVDVIIAAAEGKANAFSFVDFASRRLSGHDRQRTGKF